MATTLLLSLMGSAGGSTDGTTRTKTLILADAGAADPEIRSALVGAIAMLPEAPARIKVIDLSEVRSDSRTRLLAIDAFTVPGNDWIYVVGQSELVRRARTGAKVYVAVLAIVLWHEMKHLRGGNEQEACRAEEALWARFVEEGLVDHTSGVQYLRGLETRPCDTPVSGLAPPVP